MKEKHKIWLSSPRNVISSNKIEITEKDGISVAGDKPAINAILNVPQIFNKKSKKIVFKPLTYVTNDTGKTRHYTPAAQEWFNSIYSYDTNYTKTLPAADKNLMALLKNYFNLQLNKKFFKPKTKPLKIRFRRLSLKKIFVGRGDLKHTSNKVIITFYVYNTEGMFLSSYLNLLQKGLFYQNQELEKNTNKIKGKRITTYNRKFDLPEFLTLREHYEWYLSYAINMINKFTGWCGLLSKYYTSLTDLVNNKILTIDEKLTLFNDKSNTNNFKSYDTIDEYLFKAMRDYRKEEYKFKYLLRFNKIKFTRQFMLRLVTLVQDLYNKKVEFNIVKLKKMHLNSDIFTQAVSLKLKDRNNKLYRVLKSSLRKIKLPNERIISLKQNKPNRDEFLVNRIRNNVISDMFSDIENGNDHLNDLLLNFYPSADNLKINIKNRFSIKTRSISLKYYVLKCLKHLKLRGVRVEAKGRLTRRATASRSVFKMKWKGGLKNVDSSFRGLSAIMLRGHVKSNLQYSVVNSKNRNGAFGVKGWVSSK